ncbi:MAG: hypothetical protein JNM77_08880 [Pseudonocardia sp.]|nr:hypothetical protein [Pseudonocardia sp.]
MSDHAPPTRAAVDRRPPRAEFIVGTGRNVVPGSSAIPVLTVKVVDYAGKDQMTAAAEVWADWQARYPGALIQVVHGDDWDVLR